MFVKSSSDGPIRITIALAVTAIVLLAFAHDSAGLVAFDWKTDSSDGTIWAFDCDFPGKDIGSVQVVSSDECSGECVDKVGCTHYAHSNDVNVDGAATSTCWLKGGGGASRQSATTSAFAESSCGILDKIVPSWRIEKSSTNAASVSSAPYLFQVTMHFRTVAAKEDMGLRMTLLQPDCTGDPIGETVVSQPFLEMTQDTVLSGYQNIQAVFDISKSGLVVEEGSAIWDADSDTATICTRLELLSDDSGSASAISMTYLDTVMQLKVDLTSDFTTTIDTVLYGGTGTPV